MGREVRCRSRGVVEGRPLVWGLKARSTCTPWRLELLLGFGWLGVIAGGLKARSTCTPKLSLGDVWAVRWCMVCRGGIAYPSPIADWTIVRSAAGSRTRVVDMVVPAVWDFLGVRECPVEWP